MTRTISNMYPGESYEDYRREVLARAAALARKINDSCSGSAEVVRRQDHTLMGCVEREPWLASLTGEYAVINVAGRHQFEVIQQVTTALFGAVLDDLDIEANRASATEAVERIMRSKAPEGADVITQTSTGQQYQIGDAARIAVTTACEQLRGKGHQITAAAIISQALPESAPALRARA